MLREFREALDARTEIIAATGRPDGACRLDALMLIGPRAMELLRLELRAAWEEDCDDYVALAERTSRLSALEKLVVRQRHNFPL